MRVALRIALAAVMAVVSAELIMRHVGYAPRIEDPDFGFVVEEGGVTRWAFEGNGTGHYGPRGVREPFQEAAPGVRVVVAGDSFTEAFHVDDDRTFVALAEAFLQRAGEQVQLLNVGVAGHRTPKYVELAPTYARVFGPEWNVVVLNDSDLLADMFVTNDTYFERDGDRLALHVVPTRSASSMRRAWRAFKAKSAFLQCTGVKLGSLLVDLRGTRMFRGASARTAIEPRAGDYPVAEALDALFDAYRGRVTIVLLPSFDIEHPDAKSDVETTFASFCGERAASCVTLRDAWEHLASRREVPFGFPNRAFGEGHLNELGHRAVGEALGRELLRLRRHGLY